MNFEEILLENTYPNSLELTREVCRYVNQQLIGKDQRKPVKIDITQIIPTKLNPKKKKVYFKYQNIITTTVDPTAKNISDAITKNNNLHKYENVTFVGSPTEVTIDIRWNGSFNHFYSDWQHHKTKVGEDSVNRYYIHNKPRSIDLINIVNHEMVHVLDALHGVKDTNPNAIPNRKVIKDYWNDDYEFNQIINSFKIYKRKFPNSWKVISTVGKLFDIIDKHAHAGDSDVFIRKDRHFRKKLLFRLKQENLIPSILLRVLELQKFFV